MHRILLLIVLGALVWGAGSVFAAPGIDCDLINETEGLTDLHCGSIEVPEDHRNVSGPTLDLTYVVLKAGHTGSEKYPLIFLSGGPGAKTLTVRRLNDWSSNPIRQERDIIFFDQRGVGYSSALPDLGAEVFEILASDADEKEESLLLGRLIRKYRDIASERDVRLEHYNTFQSARDTGAVMKSLGYDKYNLYGVSYGTRLARVVQSEFPALVHAVVHNSPNPMGEDFLGSRLASYSLALERVFEHCRHDAECNRSYPELESSYFAAIRTLSSQPLTVAFEDREFVVNAQDGIYLLRRALYRVSSLESVPKVIQGLQSGGGESLEELLDYEHQLNDLINFSMLLSVERYETFDPSATSSSISESYSHHRLLPVRLGFFDSFYRAGMVWHDATLAREARVFQPSERPTLLMVNQFDPVTPPESALLFQKTLASSRLLILDQGGHGGGKKECRNQVMMQFMNDPAGTLDTSCLNLVDP